MWVVHLLVWLFRSLEAAERKRMNASTNGRPQPGAVPNLPQGQQPQPAGSPRLQQAEREMREMQQKAQQLLTQQRPSPSLVHRATEARFTHHALPPMVDDAPGGPIDWFMRMLEGVRR
jgi:hypothetical protein